MLACKAKKPPARTACHANLVVVCLLVCGRGAGTRRVADQSHCDDRGLHLAVWPTLWRPPSPTRMSRELGHPFVIENIAGAGGGIGRGLAARAKPDGYTELTAHRAGSAYRRALVDGARLCRRRQETPWCHQLMVHLKTTAPCMCRWKSWHRRLAQSGNTSRSMTQALLRWRC